MGLLIVAATTANCADIRFDDDVLPVLAEYCLDCHGPDDAESDLRLDSNLGALRGGDSGERVVVPGHSGKSHLIDRVTDDDPAARMPPDSDPLTRQQIQLLRAWIDDGAQWEAAAVELSSQQNDHWSFQTVIRPVEPGDGTYRSIDAFVAARLSDSGLSMSDRASRRRLIRRLYLVMLGLPPTPEHVEQFINDQRPDAWERLVDEVLESPRYGERWAAHWLDLIRFGETHGFETNRERPNAWHFRDWVIDALNSDMPYDEFVVQQIAGDAVGAEVSTGFLVAGPFDLVKGQDLQLRLMQRQDELADMINTTGTTFLGLTLGCARCHNHKFDPITQTDYYSLQAVFAGVNHADRALPLSAEAIEHVSALDEEIAELNQELAKYIRQSGFAHLLLDDGDQTDGVGTGIEYLAEPAGTGENPSGSARGFADDHGSENRAANISGGAYTWWKNEPGRDVAVYRPFASGRYRIWLSWGAGWSTHTEDGRFLLDKDGDVSTTANREPLAVVNQQLFADGTGEVPGQSLWSGFYNAGVHELTAQQAVVVQGGETGTAVTADALLLEPISDGSADMKAPATPGVRAAVQAKHNVENFRPVPARFVRFTINDTNASQPCIDELEVYAGDRNVALADLGARPSSSGDFEHPLHKLEHINDGQYGNPRSWISARQNGGWVQIELPEVLSIDRIDWGRDREGQYSDRLAIDYVIDISTDGETWQTVASSADRLPFRAGASALPTYDFAAFPADEAARGRELLARRDVLATRRESVAAPQMVYAGTFSQPGPTHRLYRGEPGSPREEVTPAAIRSLTDLTLPADAPEQQRRLAIAEWIVEKDNPLTARVLVNRLWQFQFGTGIVDTPSDFGGNGTMPTHPELLDWLAAEFIDSGWSVKHLQRLILMSDTWCQDSRPRDEALQVDAGTRLLWRFPPRRLEAEGIRDCMLAVSGKLDLRMGGPGFSAFEIEPENVRHYFPKTNYGPEDWRRMIYMTRVRQERDSVFGVFDCPDGSQVVPVRSRSTTPLQALNLLNSRFVMQQSGFFIERLEEDAPTTEAMITLAYQLCFSRPPETDEIRLAAEFIEATSWRQFARAMLNANEFVFIP